MWLLQTETLTLEEFFDRVVPQYAILSHTWESEEVSFCELQDLNKAREKRGFVKIEYTCQQARLDGYKYAWIDTCCIDKSSSAELQEAINSMFVWYRSARVCYVYLCDLPGSFVKPVELVHSPDVSHDPSWAQEFAGAKWFTRGWTLQVNSFLHPLSNSARDLRFVGVDRSKRDQILHLILGLYRLQIGSSPRYKQDYWHR